MSANEIQLAAIRYFAARYGRHWKSRLNSMWWSGSDASEVNGAVLRQIRNELGPVWLSKYVLDGDSNVVAHDQATAQSIVERVCFLMSSSVSPWEQSAAKEWKYTNYVFDGKVFRVGTSTGGAISIDGAPHTPDSKAVIASNHLFEFSIRVKALYKK